ncbi:MAG: TMEM165/GDT1 family protein [Motiliproteus sp.]|nr:TMEM165/GDT1 family protein [Motiliproteus sp.]MCW9053655.1 TMEM165/GDT1 family protein [Motiliproteus sp.]
MEASLIIFIESLLTAGGLSFVLIFLAEFGDKSQLVCMTLAARHRPWPVLLGAVCAFALLNLVAVLFGASVARWLPEFWIALMVGVMFALFGVQALLSGTEEEETVTRRSGHGLFVTAFLMIFLAELGDKTQLAVAGLGAAQPALPVWLGATLALTVTSAMGVLAGRTLLQKFPILWLHRASGMLFLIMAALAFYRVFSV